MSKIYADTIETENTNVDITLGASGDAVLLPSGATLKTNNIADAGGNNLITSDGAGALTVNSGLGGSFKLLQTQTVSDQTGIAFTSNLDSTYDVYCFKMINIQPETANVHFRFNGSTDSGSNYNVTKTTTAFRHTYQTGTSYFGYQDSTDLAQSTDYQILGRELGGDAKESFGGEVWLFNPSSTTYVKNFYTVAEYYNDYGGTGSMNFYIGGYMNTTSAVDAINFNMASGNLNGTIKLYGISKS